MEVDAMSPYVLVMWTLTLSLSLSLSGSLSLPVDPSDLFSVLVHHHSAFSSGAEHHCGEGRHGRLRE